MRKINRIKHLQTLIKYENYRYSAKDEYLKLKEDRLFVLGLAIYWGEGNKTECGRIAFVNSDVRMLKVMIRFYREVLNIPEDKLRAEIFIYNDINEKKALDFWAKSLNLDKRQFIKTQVLPSKSGITKHKVINGMCDIYYSSVEDNIKMKQWIDLLATEMRA
ncbi:MAG: hypothetical protein ABSC49_02835 [Candidatus Microgenomates bacterium]